MQTKEPVLVLWTKEETLAAIRNAEWHAGRDRFCVKSLWIMDLIAECEAESGFAYNSQIQAVAEKMLGIEPQGNGALAILIYNARHYRESDSLKESGFSVGSAELLAEAFRRNAKIELPCGTLLTVRRVDGVLYAMKPRKRAWAMRIEGQPCKIHEPSAA